MDIRYKRSIQKHTNQIFITIKIFKEYRQLI